MPSYGFFIRNVNGIHVENIDLHFLTDDERPSFVLDSVKNADFHFVNAQTLPGIPVLQLQNTENVKIFQSFNMKDASLASTSKLKL